MKNSKRQARERGRQAKREVQGAQPDGRAQCPSCKIAVLPDARYCHKCGAGLDAARAPGRWHAPSVILYSIIGLAVLVAASGIVLMSGGSTPVALSPTVSSAPSDGAAQTVDLSTMSPREAADRLFNRVIMASEQGNMEEALRFAPKTIQAYERVTRLDADAHYHMGLIYSVMDDLDSVRDQVSIIKQFAPNHLLGLILEHDTAEKEGNLFGAERAATAFAEAYDAEIMAGRPEYEAHRNTIESFRTEKTKR